MKFMIGGYGRHGKDTLCEILQEEFGLTFESSSWAALDQVIWPQWGHLHYKTRQECFDDRHRGDNRTVWFELIKEFNSKDLARLGRLIYARNPVYCGIRNDAEFYALRDEGVFDISVWVDATERLEADSEESSSSCKVNKEDFDIILTNNGSLEEFRAKVIRIFSTWLK